MMRLVNKRSPFIAKLVVASWLLLSGFIFPLLVLLVVAWSHNRLLFEFRTNEYVVCKCVPR